jgi:hypothetical protein
MSDEQEQQPQPVPEQPAAPPPIVGYVVEQMPPLAEKGT